MLKKKTNPIDLHFLFKKWRFHFCYVHLRWKFTRKKGDKSFLVPENDKKEKGKGVQNKTKKEIAKLLSFGKKTYNPWLDRMT